jgi:hypothetical protein
MSNSRLLHLLPVSEFKVVRPDDDEDFGQKLALYAYEDGTFELRFRSGKSYLPTNEARFPSIRAAQTYAQSRYECGARFE